MLLDLDDDLMTVLDTYAEKHKSDVETVIKETLLRVFRKELKTYQQSKK